MNDTYFYLIIALMPLSASMLVFQTNPYHALVVRGILGAISALVYALLGAADVALTEALVGTMLSITLYAVAVRSSLVMRLGVLKDNFHPTPTDSPPELLEHLRQIFYKRHMRIELVPYEDIHALQQALQAREIHATCTWDSPLESKPAEEIEEINLPKLYPTYHTTTRVQRIYDIIQAELSLPATSLSYVNLTDTQEKHK